MSDLTASQCGCNERSCGCNNNNGGCGGILWIIILLFLCNGNGCGSSGISSIFGNGGCGCDDDCGSGCEGILILLLILSCCGGNSIF